MFAEQVDGLTTRYARKTPCWPRCSGASRSRWPGGRDRGWPSAWASRPSKLDPFKPYLDQHADEGHGSFTRLFNEIKAFGYDGSYSVVHNYLDHIHPQKAPSARPRRPSGTSPTGSAAARTP